MTRFHSVILLSALTLAGQGRALAESPTFDSVSSRSWAGTETRISQGAMTPQAVLERLKEGNARFVAGLSSNRDYLAQAEATAAGQYPMAIILGCVDSRVPVETIFDLGIGDSFVARVAGNVAREDVIGSLEFATAAAGAKAIVVLGHTACGAVKGAIDKVQMGNLTGLLKQIEPAVADLAKVEDEEMTSANAAFVDRVTEQNVRNVIARILDQSSVIAALASEGRIVLTGGMYDLNTGKVTFMD